MKIVSMILTLVLSIGLVSCNQHGKTDPQSNMIMQHLTILLERGISMMSQGATLKLQGDKHGDVMLEQSADLLRRAMSGPEMAAMHKGGQGQSPAMHRVHDLGAAAFDLLDVMMSLQASPNRETNSLLHHALNMAAQGASLKSLAIIGMSGNLDKAMQQHGQSMQDAASHLIQGIPIDTAYQKAVFKVIHLLINNTPEPMLH